MAAALLCAEPAIAQTSLQCTQANDQVTALRLGKDRQGRPVRRDLQAAVATGNARAGACRSHDGFLLAYSLARVDLAGQVTYSTAAARTVMLDAAIADLETVKLAVLSGRSSRYEVFSILALIYYDTRQYQRSIGIADSAGRIFARVPAVTRQKLLVTRGMAEAQLGRRDAAAKSFDQASANGSTQASIAKRKMIGK